MEGTSLWVKLFKEGKYAEAVSEFGKYLETELSNKDRKVCHYNRGMAHCSLGQYRMALLDGDQCIQMDRYWAKGYKCKGMPLEGMKMKMSRLYQIQRRPLLLHLHLKMLKILSD